MNKKGSKRGQVKQVDIKQPLTKAQIKDYFDTFPEGKKAMYRNKIFFKTLLFLGLRYSEGISLLFTDIFIDNEGDAIFKLASKNSKNGRASLIPIPEELYNDFMELSKLFKDNKKGYVFKQLSKNLPLNKAYIRKISVEHGKLAGIPFSTSTHTFRRTYAYFLLKKSNGDLSKVSTMMRHQNLSTTLIYLSMFHDEKKEANEGLFDNF